ncbi:hypothetical protein PIB30_088424, partial [Stylosanthes scabra]|nr:hypothetical protein [Stylosanthes scabra]
MAPMRPHAMSAQSHVTQTPLLGPFVITMPPHDSTHAVARTVPPHGTIVHGTPVRAHGITSCSR